MIGFASGSMSRNAIATLVGLASVALGDVRARALPRFAFIILLACAAMLLLADTSSARPINLKGTYDAGTVKRDCDAAGGSYSHGADGSYGCAANGGTVSCDKNGKCYGNCQKCGAAVKGPGSILRPPASAGTVAAHGVASSSQSTSPAQNVGHMKSGKH